jgi:NADH:ubiquinone oxidoreductase subunit 6 (subunit J)
MTVLFYIAAVVAVLATVMVVTRRNLVHALLYLVISLFAVAVVFYTLGAPFVAALEVIVYAGAIMMLFVFAVMLLNLSADSPVRVPRIAWLGPAILVAVLLAEMIYGLTMETQPRRSTGPTCSAWSSRPCCCSPRSSARATWPRARATRRRPRTPWSAAARPRTPRPGCPSRAS